MQSIFLGNLSSSPIYVVESLLFEMISGFSIAVSLGMNEIICIKFSLNKGFIAGFVSEIGESTAVGFYAWLVISSAFLSKIVDINKV